MRLKGRCTFARGVEFALHLLQLLEHLLLLRLELLDPAAQRLLVATRRRRQRQQRDRDGD
jgi:hypothetical protein